MNAGNPLSGQPVRWGVLGAAGIAVHNVIPAMQQSPSLAVLAIASRERARAEAVARDLGIPRAYGSYQELLDDPDVEAIYNPLPNHLHVPWSIKAAEAGKHVLCEKPLALTADDARRLLAVRERTGVCIGEAFMVRTHPQWLGVRELVREGRIGDLRLVVGHFSYYRDDPDDVRNRVEWGGGVLLDIGCYPITLSRWLFGAEPLEVAAMLERDPVDKVDRIAAGMLRFPAGQACFTVAGRLVPFQRMDVFGTTGRIQVEIPFNAPPDRPSRILVDDGSAFAGAHAEASEFPAVDQYRLQGERFAAAIRGRGAVPVGLEDAIANMAVIDALFRSAEARSWEAIDDVQG